MNAATKEVPLPVVSTVDSSPLKVGHGVSYTVWVIFQYWVVSISMVYLNKFLLSNDNYSIPAPLFITWLQCVVTSIICVGISYIGNASSVSGDSRSGGDQSEVRKKSLFESYQTISYDWQIATKVLPLTLVFVGMISFNNFCLKFVEVSFYNVARSLSLIFNVILSFLILEDRISVKLCGVLAIIVVGFIIGIEGEVNFSIVGTASGVISSVFVSLNSIMTKKVSKEAQLDNNTLLFYNNANASLLFIPLIATFERQILLEHLFIFTKVLFWMSASISGTMGFCIGLVTILQVTVTSPLTHNISGTAKAAVQSVLAFYIWGNPATVRGIWGICLVLFGSSLYTYLRSSNQ